MRKVTPDLSSVTVVGLDLAKHVFQVHCLDDTGKVLLKRREVMDFFRKLPTCRVGLDACSSAHHWARQLLALGHDVKLIPPAYVTPYVRRGCADTSGNPRKRGNDYVLPSNAAMIKIGLHCAASVSTIQFARR